MLRPEPSRPDGESAKDLEHAAIVRLSNFNEHWAH